VALVTGAAQGMGRAMALALAEAGADLLLADLQAERNEATAGEVVALGRRAVPVTCDIAQPEQVERLYATLDAEFGRIDVLGNVAGRNDICRPEDVTLDMLHSLLDLMVVGKFHMCQQAGRRMLAAGKGSIINIGSLASITALGRGNFMYSLCMGAVAQMTRELSTEWAGRGVRVNAILPAQVTNPGLEERMASDPALADTFRRGIPRGRLGVPEDIQGLAVFLASDASDWITGALIPMDGGNLAMNAGGTHGARR
jgi:NAD(P)-dependent dehydrogenase (short-subunit alcohol dehydrogenase family)